MRALLLLNELLFLFIISSSITCTLSSNPEETSTGNHEVASSEISKKLTPFELEHRLLFNPSYSVAVVSNVDENPKKKGRAEVVTVSQSKSLSDSRISGLDVTAKESPDVFDDKEQNHQIQQDKTKTENDETITVITPDPTQEDAKTERSSDGTQIERNVSSIVTEPKTFDDDINTKVPYNTASPVSFSSSSSGNVEFESSTIPNVQPSGSTTPKESEENSVHNPSELGITAHLLTTSKSPLSSLPQTEDLLPQISPIEKSFTDISDDYQLLVTEMLPTQKVDVGKTSMNHQTSTVAPQSILVSRTSPPTEQNVPENSMDNGTNTNDSQALRDTESSFLRDLKIRKCCEKLEFFNLNTSSCEPIIENQMFFQLTNTILREKAVGEIALMSSQLKCPGNQGPKTTIGISNDTHVIIDSGTVYDVSSGHAYNHSEYCLELVGKEFNSSLLTVAYCDKSPPDYSFYADYPDTLGEDYYEEETLDTYDLTVRKCCQEFEYYNSQLHKCVEWDNFRLFHDSVKQISFGSENVGLNIISSRLRSCPNQVDLPTIHTLDSSIFRLRYNGDIIDTSTGLQYDYSYYCMENIGDTNETIVLNIALCNKADFLLPKCCPNGHYFDEDELNCLPIPQSHSIGKNLLREYLLDNYTYALEELNYFLPCQNALPAKEIADNFLFREGRLCLQETCYGRKDFCLDYVGHARAVELQPVAFYCRKNFFVKCCDQNQILHEDGCVEYSDGNSLLMKQLTRTRSIVRFFNYKECSDERALLLEDSFTKYIQWWLGDSGTHLIVESSTQVKELANYCIDDFKDPDGKVSPSAYVCESEVENMIPIEKTQRIFKRKGSLGKCCPRSPDANSMYFFSSVHGDCQIIENNGSLSLINYFNGTSYNKEHFHDFPKCSNDGKGYHAYPLKPGHYDHTQLSNDGNLKFISMNGKCVEEERLVTDRDFCFEYIMNADGKLEPSAVVCAYTSVLDVYHEKYSLVTALLGISCVCLFATLVSLCTMRVRRGLVSTRKIHTLAGRILVSFVGSHLIGYFSLALMQHDNLLNKETSPSCYILAALIQFFNLATFCWNTSICLESLLLTIHISISELLRYFLHSLWAWGFPGFMTLIMLLMDAYKDELPCGTITPNIGVHRCFHSDTEARLLYFYLPIFITLTSNVLFLVGAKALRNARLRRLEKGTPKPKKSVNGTENLDSNETSGHSGGMRTHQSQNTKAESLRLVLWTGGTWFLELAGFVITKYILPHSRERWFEYLWYIPTSINALRGVGIFAIIVLTPETRTKISNATADFRDQVSSRFKSQRTSPSENKSFSANGSQSTYPGNRRRNMSITTMISNISYFRNSSVTGKNKISKIETELSTSSTRANQPSMVRSVSQNGRKSSLTSGASIEELMTDKGRRCSIPMNNIALPEVQEENSPHISKDPEEMSSSDV